MRKTEREKTRREGDTCGQCYKHFMMVNYDSRFIIWGIFKSGMSLEL